MKPIVLFKTGSHSTVQSHEKFCLPHTFKKAYFCQILCPDKDALWWTFYNRCAYINQIFIFGTGVVALSTVS